ncbi:hypothetical protein CU097_003177, partial [Rhizopus azygosporus]
PLTVKQYLEKNYVNKSFNFLELLKALQPDPNDRALIEKEIEDTVHDILTDATNETALQYLASTIAILRSDPVINYWNMLKLQRTSCQNAMKQNINALNEVQKSYKRYNTRSHRPENENDEVYEIDGMMLAGMKRSVGSVIKTEAIRRAKAAKYAFTPDEAYFEIYAHVIRLLNKHNSILKNESVKSPTEQDFVGEVWTPIMSSIFNHRDLYLKWGDSVPQISTTARKRLREEEKMVIVWTCV